MATRSLPCPRHLDAGSLIDLISDSTDRPGAQDPVVIGVEPHGDRIDLHVAPLPQDDRAAAAGLFGMRAGDGWCAVGVALSGRARRLDHGGVIGAAAALVVVDRSRAVASRLVLDGTPVAGEHGEGDGAPAGLTVDALHRMLGLPSPGEPPAAAHLAMAVWSQLLILHALEHPATTWADAVRLHPGHPGGQQVQASVETVVEATLRTEQDLSWSRLHRRGCAGHGPADLSPTEAAWMDATLYGRWLLSALPDAELAAQVLVAHGAQGAAKSVLEVADQVVRRVGPVNTG